MKLRIVSGSLKGRYLTLRDTWANFRPTQQRVRQALVEKIKELISGATAADLCAGSGAFGFELLSRGAAMVHFIERDRVCGSTIAHHCRLLGVEDRCVTHSEDVRRFIDRCERSYDILFYDPPYEDLSLARLAPRLLTLCSPGGVVVYEYDAGAAASQVVWPEHMTEFERETRRYGDTSVDFFYRR